MPVRSDRVSVLVLSVWVEDGWPDGFRARITSTDYLTPREEVSTVVATPEQVMDAVEEWLDAQREGPDEPGS